ncbi:MAG: hypothetical protein V8R11_07000 [Alphaproteobacteria bacterium]
MTETSQPEKQDPQNVYELMENDDGEVMVLLFAGEGTPQNPSFTLDEANRLIELSRSKNDIVLIEGLLPNAVEKLKKLSVLYVCEMKYNENPEAENEILHAYAAALKKKSSRSKTPTQNRRRRKASPKKPAKQEKTS